MNSFQRAEKARAAAAQAGRAAFFPLGRLAELWTKGGLGVQVGLSGLMALLVVFLAFPVPVDYQIGQVAENTIRADHSFRLLDRAATENKKLEAENKVLPVLMLDDLLPPLLEKQAEQLFQRARGLLAGWDDLSPGAGSLLLAALKSDFRRLFNLPEDSPIWPDLLDRGFAETLEKQALVLVREIMAGGFLDESAPDLPGPAAAVTVISLSNRAEHVQPRLDALIGREELNRLLEVQARKLALDYDQKETELILALARGLARPNLKPDQHQTQTRLWQAWAEVKDIYAEVRPGQVIVQEGTVIDQDALDRIKALKVGQAREADWLRRCAAQFLALVLFYNLTLALFSLSFHGRLVLPPPREQIFLALILVLATLATHIALVLGTALSWDFDSVDNHTFFYGLPLPAAAMLGGVFFGLRRATLVLVLVAVAVAMVIPGESRILIVLYVINGGIVAALSLRNMKERKSLAPASFWVMVVNTLTLTCLTLYSDSAWGRQTANNFLAAAASGFFSGILTSGLIPLVEMTFGFNTNLKMLELGNLDRPLLRELMLSAPGTYHHSVAVGALVEAAAEAIGANPYVAKVGAYYHDIGKMKKPLYFVENQAGDNRHDTLAPSMSALVLVGHVREGAELARANQLPRIIVEIVEQHHGVSLMRFFYQKAKEQHQPGQPEINEGDFRYPGPKPRSPEAGLVMLGDICEAATRALAEPTPLKIRNVVKSMVNQVFSDGQLDECDLKTSEIAAIVNIFTTVLTGIFHHRAPHPRRRIIEAGRLAVQEPWPESRKTKETVYAHLPVEPPKGTTH